MPAVIVTILLLFLAAAQPAGAEPHTRADGHVHLAWLDDRNASQDVISRLVGVSVVAPTWWQLAAQPGTLIDRADPELAAWAGARGVAVWPVLDGDDPGRTHLVLHHEPTRARLVEAVLAAAERTGVSGVNIDFPHLRPESREGLTDLVTDLKAGGLVVAVSVPPRTDASWSAGYDHQALAGVADYLILLAFDQHHLLRRDGPVAGLPWVTAAVDDLLEVAPADQILLGLSLYTREWVVDGDEPGGVALQATLGMRAMDQRLGDVDTVLEQDPEHGLDRHTFVDERGREHRVWHEGLGSVHRRVGIMADHRLGGVASWRAGLELPTVWPVIDEALRQAPGPEAGRRSGQPQLQDAVRGPDVAPQGPPARPPPPSSPDASSGDGVPAVWWLAVAIAGVGLAFRVLRDASGRETSPARR